MDQEMQERLDLINKRIDDNKTLITTIVSTGTAIFAVIAIIFTWNVNTEKNDLKELKRELKLEVETFLGKNIAEPELKMFTRSGASLSGATLNATVEMDEFEMLPRIELPVTFRNDGQAPTGEVTVKAYTKKEIRLSSDTTFEDDYEYEVYWQGTANTGVPNMPGGGFAYPYRFTLWPSNGEEIASKTHKVKLQIYYANDKVAESEFYIALVNKLQTRNEERED